MARKAKDLFVILAERQERSRSTPKRAGRKAGRQTSSKSGGKSGRDKESVADKGREAAAAVGGTLGRWFQGAVKTLRPEEAGGGKARPRSRGPVREVPRGLIVPGWLLVGMLMVTLGGGFLIGRVTAGLRSDAELNRGAQAAKPRDFDTSIPDLTPAEEVAELSDRFYVAAVFLPGEKTQAAQLARELRNRGIRNARILFRENDSISRWATVCYVAPSEDKQAALARLQRHEAELGFEAWPKLCRKSDP